MLGLYSQGIVAMPIFGNIFLDLSIHFFHFSFSTLADALENQLKYTIRRLRKTHIGMEEIRWPAQRDKLITPGKMAERNWRDVVDLASLIQLHKPNRPDEQLERISSYGPYTEALGAFARRNINYVYGESRKAGFDKILRRCAEPSSC